jgi:hypothetical protein
MGERHREGAKIRSAIHDAKARQPQVSFDDLEPENGPVYPISVLSKLAG